MFVLMKTSVFYNNKKYKNGFGNHALNYRIALASIRFRISYKKYNEKRVSLQFFTTLTLN